MSKVHINVKPNGKHEAIMVVNIGLGEVSDERTLEEGTSIIGIGIHGAHEFYKRSIYERVLNGEIDFEEYESLLEQYFIYELYKKIGVLEYPIRFNREGDILSFSEEVEVILEQLKE